MKAKNPQVDTNIEASSVQGFIVIDLGESDIQHSEWKEMISNKIQIEYGPNVINMESD